MEKITKENYDQYNMFYMSKLAVEFTNLVLEHAKTTITEIGTAIGVIIAIVGAGSGNLGMVIASLSCTLALDGAVYGCVHYKKKQKEKMLEERYPNIDRNVTTDELGEKIKEYENECAISAMSKDERMNAIIEKEKEKHLSKYSDVQNMTTEERLAYFNNEKEFLESVATNEKIDEKKKKLSMKHAK